LKIKNTEKLDKKGVFNPKPQRETKSNSKPGIIFRLLVEIL